MSDTHAAPKPWLRLGQTNLATLVFDALKLQRIYQNDLCSLPTCSLFLKICLMIFIYTAQKYYFIFTQRF